MNEELNYIDKNSFKFYQNIDKYIDYDSYKLYPDKRRNKLTKFNNKCITDCKLAGHTIRHPIHNIQITEFDGPFCATHKYLNPENNSIKYHDICRYSEGDLLAWSDMDTSSFIPLKPSVCMQLLSQFHNINNIEDAKKWEATTKVSNITKQRVLNCAWKAFNLEEDPETIQLTIDKIVLTFQQIAINEWINYIYNGLNRYYNINLSKNEVLQEIKKMLSDKKLIKYLLNTYRKENKLDWLSLKFHMYDIKIHIVKELKTII